MASNKNILSEILSSSPNFFSQLVFGFLLAIISSFAGASLILSLFVGIMGGVALGWFTNVNENNPQIPDVASNDGIDAALKYWLFFMFSFVFLGYSAPISILFGGIAAVGGGWIIAWWRSKEATQTQLSDEILEEAEIPEPNEKSTRGRKRISTRRYRRASGSFNFRFWQK
ncbi:MAG: hypothetical protein ACKO9I_19395 [Sphaerospermopsis kisseleviana]|jgi:hypothetical protein|uniref:Uncharacterized protein n=3 Tax=Sphaerospermopsis TaxID=752201 RepID=A0A480A8X0_9CYAN|nr:MULTISPECIES: hypothetical protein [Sphaerospermopsis]BAZ82297.1 hypothetical protein NIES73_35730 [Sphaerospermopsis kisseleviana NIES-73]MBC5795211.1 hypothetical protein [Sphaerospermopsis sp. LEGE 00249]MBD2133508.1 hypothetical protein [Sphaerospermopsis sp. FACHB-1094]MBD2146624.1 hypothetical protein [Sphaerospermopsis sp. FACHB-1194]MBE9237545.1 hypothetical protein [Sphaerospermopsis aphanizomenoides LEGE 00250]